MHNFRQVQESNPREICTAILAFLALFAFFPKVNLSTAYAQTNTNDWSAPKLLFQGVGSIDTPILAADQTGTVNLLWQYKDPPDEDGHPGIEMIYYSELNRTDWTKPIDVIARGGVTTPSAVVGANGILHFLANDGGLILYSHIPVNQTTAARNWPSLREIAASNLQGDITVDDKGAVHIVFPGPWASGPYYLTSHDDGEIWSQPVNVASTSRKNASSQYAQLAIGNGGVIHIVWSEFQLPDAWPPLGVYYSRSKDGGRTWSIPMQIAGYGYDQIAIAVDGEIVHTVYNGMVGVGGRYHRWSQDGGKTWSPITKINGNNDGGTEGLPQLAFDSIGSLHLVTTFNNCVQYAFWQNNTWSKFKCISGERAKITKDIEQPAMTISEGNKLHVVFWDERKTLWYTTKEVSAPAIVATPFVTQLPHPIEKAKELPGLLANPTSAVVLPITTIDPVPINVLNINLILLAGITPIIILILCIAGFRYFHSSKQ